MMVKKIVLIAAVALVALPMINGAADEKKGAMSPLLGYLADPAYDTAAAKEFAGDEYGMKKFVMAFLKRGPNRTQDPQKARELQTAHLKNIDRLAAEGKLVLAGPFLDDGELRGIYVFNVSTLAEAEALTKSDPAIRAGSLVMELKEWYGSAALMAVNAIHGKLSRESISGAGK